VHGTQIDLADLASVGDLLKNWTGPLHILVNNAGIMATPERHTPQGRELRFAANHPKRSRTPSCGCAQTAAASSPQPRSRSTAAMSHAKRPLERAVIDNVPLRGRPRRHGRLLRQAALPRDLTERLRSRARLLRGHVQAGLSSPGAEL